MKQTISLFQRWALCVVMLLTACTLLAAQANTGSVSGTVSDDNGAAIASARVELLTSQQATLATTTTDAQGRFTFSNVTRGSYQIIATREGFGTRRAALTVPGSADSNVNLTLNPLEVSESVTITAETGRAESVDRVVQQVNVISSDALQQRATAVLAQVADEEPGISLQRTSPSLGAIYVRGLTGKNVATYIDGVRYTIAAARGGINTFFNLTDPSELRAVEVLRGPNSAQYGSDSLGGTVSLISRTPVFGSANPETHGDFATFYTSADNSFGSNATVTYGTRRFGLLLSGNGRRVNTLRSADGLDGHAAVTRFFGVRSDIAGIGTRLPDTAFTQYGGLAKIHYAPTNQDQVIFHYQRNQQDGGKRYDQTLGGDGNLISDLRNLMADFFYTRYTRADLGFFDSGSFTFSYNNQREERVNQGGRGNPAADIVHQYDRTRVYGGSFFLTKELFERNSLLIGGDFYRERFTSPAYSFRPTNNTFFFSRPRVPNGTLYRQGGLYAQNTWEFVPNRARLSAALRYNVANYRVRQADSPIFAGRPPDDSLRFDDFSGRVGVVVFPDIKGLSLAFNYSRGFRAPSMTDLGTLGLTGDGFEVDVFAARALNGTIGTSALNTAISTGLPVTQQRSEVTNNIDATVRYRRSRFDTDFTFFNIDLNDAIIKRALIAAPGSVGRTVGSEVITRQDANGTIYVAATTNPVLVRTNISDARIYGFEYSTELKISSAWTFGGNFTYLHSADKDNGLPPDIEGGTPPPTGFVRLRYQPPGKRYWLEAYSTMTRPQRRLSSLDLADRRTGATRTRADIANFFNRGARVRGLVSPGTDNIFGTADDRLIATNETLTQIQNRVLGTANSAPLYDHLPGYGLFNLRGGLRFGERHTLGFDFENITDQAHRNPSWGVDGPGRSISARYQFRF